MNDNKVLQHSIIDEPDYNENIIEQNLIKKFNNAIDISNIKENKENVKNSFSFLDKCSPQEKRSKTGLSINNLNNLTFEENFKTPVKKNKLSSIEKVSSGNYQKSADTKGNDSNTVYTVYDLDFIKNMLEMENEYNPDPDYIENQPNIKVDHRAVLVDWLMELCEEFAFKRDTFHYTVNYIDRFLSVKPHIEKKKFQLIGVVSLSIASKFEVSVLY